MLIKFSIENWKSFQDPNDFSMIATKSTNHEERVHRSEKYGMGILPISAIYGGNASGKTNFCSAFEFVRSMVVDARRPDSPIPLEQSMMQPEDHESRSRFEIVMLIGEDIHQFVFVVTNESVIEEKLARMTPGSGDELDEKVLYHLVKGKGTEDSFEDVEDDEERKRLEFARQGTSDNQLFLSNSVSQNVDTYSPVYDWFRNLRVIYPTSMLNNIGLYFHEKLNIGSELHNLDTGITNLHMEEIPFEGLREEVRNETRKHLGSGRAAFYGVSEGDRILVSNVDGRFKAGRMMTEHSKSDGNRVKFKLSQEASGSLRLMDLIPAFLHLTAEDSDCVYVIDELDRSLHPRLSRHLIQSYLNGCSTSNRSQLIFTTHDVQFLDRNLFRIDELWYTSRDYHGLTTIEPFSEYGHLDRSDEIRRKYLQGRLGGIPDLLPVFDK